MGSKIKPRRTAAGKVPKKTDKKGWRGKPFKFGSKAPRKEGRIFYQDDY